MAESELHIGSFVFSSSPPDRRVPVRPAASETIPQMLLFNSIRGLVGEPPYASIPASKFVVERGLLDSTVEQGGLTGVQVGILEKSYKDASSVGLPAEGLSPRDKQRLFDRLEEVLSRPESSDMSVVLGLVKYIDWGHYDAYLAEGERDELRRIHEAAKRRKVA